MSSFNTTTLFSIDGLVAVITGGGTGIGLMMAKALALNGAHKVYIIGRRETTLQSAAKESPHGNIIPIVGDVTSKSDLERITKQIQQEVGYVNVLIANSGISGPQVSSITKETPIEEFQRTLWNQDFQEYTQTFAVNCSAAFFSVIAFLSLLDAGNKQGNVEQHSQVIITSSIAGFNRAPTAGYAYGQSKAATTHMVKMLATNLVPYDIRANAIAPGLYPSEMTAPIIGTATHNFPKDKIPAQRIGSAEDMAGTVLYLTSRAGAYCNGVVVITDGGRLSVAHATY